MTKLEKKLLHVIENEERAEVLIEAFKAYINTTTLQALKNKERNDKRKQALIEEVKAKPCGCKIEFQVIQRARRINPKK